MSLFQVSAHQKPAPGARTWPLRSGIPPESVMSLFVFTVCAAMMQAGLLGVSPQTDAQRRADCQSSLGQSSGWSLSTLGLSVLYLLFVCSLSHSSWGRADSGSATGPLSQLAHAPWSSFLLGEGAKKDHTPVSMITPPVYKICKCYFKTCQTRNVGVLVLVSAMALVLSPNPQVSDVYSLSGRIIS